MTLPAGQLVTLPATARLPVPLLVMQPQGLHLVQLPLRMPLQAVLPLATLQLQPATLMAR